MRYAHMVRNHDAAAPAVPDASARKFAPLSKRATTAALDLRTVARSLRGPRFVQALIVAPFLFALLAAVIRPRPDRRTLPDSRSAPVVPDEFRKYRYEEIRAGATKPVHFSAKIQIGDYHKALQSRRAVRVDPETSVSLIAACKNRKESLALTLPSWESVKGLDEIVLVDWGSDSQDWNHLPLLSTLVRAGNVSFIQVREPGDWALTRAYNLAAKFAVGRYILRVDCDTHLNPDFISANPPPEPGKYYTVGWGTERDKNEVKLRGVWFARKDDFTKVGGYDERIVNYGYEDLDLYRRMQTNAELEAKYINLDTIRHNIAGDMIWPKDHPSGTTSHAVSTRMNKAVIESSPPWTDVSAKGETMKYDFAYSRADASLYATIIRDVPDPFASKTPEEKNELKIDVLRKALHDEFKIPWDIIPSFSLEDLEYLANFLDGASDARILVVCLDGPDAISNVFNLVSAVELGISLRRPVVVIWRGFEGVSVDQSNGPIVHQLFDLNATNALLQQVPEAEAAKKLSITGTTRLIAAKEWPCVEQLQACADKYDKAYNTFSEVELGIRHSYDESDPIPLRVRQNGLLKLSNKTRIGTDDTRALAYKSLVQSHVVREEQRAFPLEPQLGIVSETEGSRMTIANDVRKIHGSAVGPGAAEVLPIVGAGHSSIRRELFGADKSMGFCQGSSCTIRQLARELANVFAMCNAEKVHPDAEAPDRHTWASRSDVTGMMVADLRMLQKK